MRGEYGGVHVGGGCWSNCWLPGKRGKTAAHAAPLGPPPPAFTPPKSSSGQAGRPAGTHAARRAGSTTLEPPHLAHSLAGVLWQVCPGADLADVLLPPRQRLVHHLPGRRQHGGLRLAAAEDACRQPTAAPGSSHSCRIVAAHPLAQPCSTHARTQPAPQDTIVQTAGKSPQLLPLHEPRTSPAGRGPRAQWAAWCRRARGTPRPPAVRMAVQCK